MVKPEEKSLTAPLPLGSQTAAAAAGGRRPLHHHNPAVRKAVAARTAASAGGPQSPVPIVRAQIRLPPPPDQLSEKTLSGEGGGGSGASTPVLSRKIELSAATSAASPLAKGGSGSTERRVPKSVASMVRRYAMPVFSIKFF
jgi:hypothetical protein